MQKADNKLWPFRPKASLLIALGVLVGLLITMALFRGLAGWPPDNSTNTVLIGILLLSLLPVVLAILDVVIDRGGTIGYGDLKIDFSKVAKSEYSGFSVPANIGVRGEPVADSGTSNILGILQETTNSGIAIINLEDGHGWWETRLLVLLSGAVRIGKPDKIVFIATQAGKEECFQGWATARELLPLLLTPNTTYQRIYHKSMTAAMQWTLLGPLELAGPATLYYTIPEVAPNWMASPLAYNTRYWAYSTTTGLQNELYAEQVLQNELGNEIERKGGSIHISITRLNELFQAVLKTQSIDLAASSVEQKKLFLETDNEFLPLTDHGRYTGLVSRQKFLNEILKSLTT